MEEITKALYSNFVNTIRETADDIQEYDCQNEQDYREIIEFLKSSICCLLYFSVERIV